MIKTIRTYTSTLLLLFLGLFYSLPYSLLHSCESLNHHHHETCIEKDHISCGFCELQLLPFIPSQETLIPGARKEHSVFKCVSVCGLPEQYTSKVLNKGPPSIF